MKSGINLGMKQSQKLVMTQSLRQSIEMLQLSTVELAELINREFLENPLLEEIQEAGETTHLEDGLNLNLSGDENDPSSSMEEEITLNPDIPAPSSGSDVERKQSFIENAVSSVESLKDHLLWQARMTAADQEEFIIYEEIITLLDPNGFLPQGAVPDNSADPYGRIISSISQFDPVGCAAPGVRESLLIQALYYYPEEVMLHQMIEKYFHEVEHLDYGTIAKAAGQSVNTILEKNRLLQNLNPFPGSSYSTKEIKYIIPDIDVKLIEGEIVITLNDEWIPGIGISSYYEGLLSRRDINKEQHDYLNAKLQSARAFMRNISTRRETILKVASAIMARQREFLDMGPGHLRYLTHHDIAEETGVHESTVSRVSSSKFVQTSWGIFELKYFFVSKIKSSQESDEGNSSSDRVRGLINEIVASENPESPYNDEEIASILREKGVTVARRTIAKYRDMLNIPSSAVRKRINMIKPERCL